MPFIDWSKIGFVVTHGPPRGKVVAPVSSGGVNLRKRNYHEIKESFSEIKTQVAPKIHSPSRSTQLLTSSFAPRNLEEFIFHKKQVSQIRTWMEVRKTGKHSVDFPIACLLSGPPGTGKTTLANLILKEFGFKVTEVNASDDRNAESTETNLIHALCMVGVVFDEIDGSLEDTGGIGTLLTFLGTHKKLKTRIAPIICTCNSRRTLSVRRLAKNSLDITFFPVYDDVLQKQCYSVARKLNHQLSPETCKRICKEAQGDFRKMLNLLQYYLINPNRKNTDEKDQEYDEFNNSFSACQKLLGPGTLCSKVDLFSQDPSFLLQMVQENAVSSFSQEDTKDLIAFSYSMSSGDIFDAHCGRNFVDPFTHSLFLASTLRPTKRKRDVRFPAFFEANKTIKDRRKQAAELCREYSCPLIDLSLTMSLLEKKKETPESVCSFLLGRTSLSK